MSSSRLNAEKIATALPQFLALLSNGCDAIVGLKLGDLTIRRRRRGWVVDLIGAMHTFPEYELAWLLEDHYQCADPTGLYIYTVEGNAPTVVKDTDDSTDFTLGELRDSFIKTFEQRIKLLRLFGEGYLAIPMWFFFHTAASESDYYSFGYDYVRPGRYALDPDPEHKLDKLLEQGDLNTSREFIRLAWDVLDESYEQENKKLELLSLMMAIEVLFNDGQGELRFRVSRAVAVLLGRTSPESVRIFAAMKSLYDVRSKIVHTGQCKTLSANHVVQLRSFARRAIILLATADLDKGDASELLTRAGFGRGRRMIESIRPSV